MSVKKRSDERVGHRIEAEQRVDNVEATDVTIPEASEMWCFAASQLWDALLESPQTVYYTSADWSFAFITMDALTECVSSGYSAMKLSAVNDMLKQLLITEPERRKANIEVKRAARDTSKEKAKVAQMDAYRKAAYGG